eukprot:10442074-Ditylum_brightwellii.AAC.1
MTRGVMFKVPIILLKKLWMFANSTPVFPVPEEYLFKFASNIVLDQQITARCELGQIFNQVLKDPGK